jgi:heme-degrading monooxygenase HmoA
MRNPPEGANTIARIWIGHTRREDRKAYERYIEETGIAGYRSTPGNQGAFLMVRDLPERTEFLTLSFWDSWASVQSFAGDDPERARYYPEDRRFLLSFPEKVRHFEVRSGPAVRPAPERESE